MMRLFSLRDLLGFSLQATDGEIGKVEQFFFDDAKWTVRYLVVRAGNWLTGRHVLLSPHAVTSIDWHSRKVHVQLNLDQIKNSPDIDTQKPVSRQMEVQYSNYYGWPYYWAGSAAWGMAPFPIGMWTHPYPIPPMPPSQTPSQPPNVIPIDSQQDDVHLRSTDDVLGYSIEATDTSFGEVDDFIMELDTWTIRYLVINTHKWIYGKQVVLPPEWIDSISWAERKFRAHLSSQAIQDAPEYLPGELSRDYEMQLYEYYGRPAYWKADKAG